MTRKVKPLNIRGEMDAPPQHNSAHGTLTACPRLLMQWQFPGACWRLERRKNPMASALPSVLTEQDEDIHEVSPANVVLLRRLGIEALPAHETMILPTERLIVAGSDHLARSAKRLVKSIQHVGILQNPSVVVQGGVDMHDEEATYEVITGRR